MAKINYNTEIEILEGVSVSVENNAITVKGANGEINRRFNNPRIGIRIEGEKIIIICKAESTSVRDKRDINTIRAHIKNMLLGAAKGYHAKVKVFSGHFPITAAVEGNVVSVKNFLGEKVPRKTTIMHGVKAVLQGDVILLEGADREAVAQSAAKVESMTRITNKDRRIFQDGCYIIEKPAGKRI